VSEKQFIREYVPIEKEKESSSQWFESLKSIAKIRKENEPDDKM